MENLLMVLSQNYYLTFIVLSILLMITSNLFFKFNREKEGFVVLITALSVFSALTALCFAGNDVAPSFVFFFAIAIIAKTISDKLNYSFGFYFAFIASTIIVVITGAFTLLFSLSYPNAILVTLAIFSVSYIALFYADINNNYKHYIICTIIYYILIFASLVV